MSCPKFNKLVCLKSTRYGKFGSADSKTIIVNLFSFESVAWWLPTGMKLKVAEVLTFCEIDKKIVSGLTNNLGENQKRGSQDKCIYNT